MIGSWTTVVRILNEEMKEIQKIVKYLQESDLLVKVVCKKIENEAKEQTDRFLSLLLGTLGASLLGTMLPGRRIIQTSEGVI